MTEIFCKNTTVTAAYGKHGETVHVGTVGMERVRGRGGTVLCSEGPRHKLGGTLNTTFCAHTRT